MTIAVDLGRKATKTTTNLRLTNDTVLIVCDVDIKLQQVLIDFSLTVKAATLIFISGCGSAISSAKEGISGFIYNLVKN